MDLSFLAPLVTTVLIPAVGAVIAGYVRQSNKDTALYEAIGRAGGVAYQNLVSSGKPLGDKGALAAAAAAGGGYLMQTMPDTLRAKGVTDPSILAGAELGKLLASNSGK